MYSTFLFFFILVSGFPVLDFFLAFRCSNVQFTSPASRFLTSSVPFAALTSNPLLRLPGFGLLPCLTLLQRPIHVPGLSVLDFIRAFLRSNVQFPLPASQFWTSSVPFSALTSNSRFRLHSFGLHPCLSPL